MTAAAKTGKYDETILVVDDSREIRELMSVLLEQEGYRVLDARNGEHAIDIAAIYAQPIDLIVTDVRMPTLGGVELIEKFRRWYPGHRCLFVSGYTDLSASLEGFEGAPTGFLAKPFTPEQLANAVRELLDRPSGNPERPAPQTDVESERADPGEQPRDHRDHYNRIDVRG